MNAKPARNAQPDAAVDCCTVNPVYCEVNKNLKAQCIYLYYVKPSAPKYKDVLVYVIDRGAHVTHDKVEGEVKTMLSEIASGKLHPCGWRLGAVNWTRRSYIVVLFEDANEKLVRCDAVRFTFNQYPYENHAFGDGKDFTVNNRISGFFCLNHMWKRDQNPVDREEFHMVVNHSRGGSPRLAIRSHDDSGTNMGPPLPPP